LVVSIKQRLLLKTKALYGIS